MSSGIALFVNGRLDAELSQASGLEVHERMGQPTRYAIRWPLAASGGDLPLAIDERIGPGAELSLRYLESDAVKVLAQGPVTGQSLRVEHGGGESWIEVLGADESVVMDREVRSQVWADGKDSDAVTAILGRHGIAADVAPTEGSRSTDKHALVQRDSDLRFVQRLARRNGCLFWITHDGAGAPTGHFRAPPLDAVSPLRLVINRAHPTIHALDLRFDVERPTALEGKQLDLNSKAILDASPAASPLAPLGARALRDIAAGARTVHVSAPADDAGDLTARGAAALLEAGWFLQASSETTRAALGGVLRAHTVIELEGAGRRHSGKYFVASVRHLIDSTVHRMVVELYRNGWEA